MLQNIREYKYFLWLLLAFVCVSALVSYRCLQPTIPLIHSISHSPSTIYPYIALVIDDRASHQLVKVILNVLEHIPSDWKVQFFTHSHLWPFYQQSSLGPFIRDNRVFMTPIGLERNNKSATAFINIYLTSPSLWRQVLGEKVLYFQIDSAICSNSLYKITDFLHYDFIGAPWAFGGCCNGGFSIRSRTKTLRLLEHPAGRYPYPTYNEDGWYIRHLPLVGGVVAPVSVAAAFSVETIYHHRPFAVHKPVLHWIGAEKLKLLCNECPELRTISDSCP